MATASRPALFNWSGANTVAGPVTLNGNCVIGGARPTVVRPFH